MKYKVLVKFGSQEKGSTIEISEEFGRKLVKKGILKEISKVEKKKAPEKPKKSNIETK